MWWSLNCRLKIWSFCRILVLPSSLTQTRIKCVQYRTQSIREVLNRKKSVKFHNREGLNKLGSFSHIFYLFNSCKSAKKSIFCVGRVEGVPPHLKVEKFRIFLCHIIQFCWFIRAKFFSLTKTFVSEIIVTIIIIIIIIICQFMSDKKYL